MYIHNTWRQTYYTLKKSTEIYCYDAEQNKNVQPIYIYMYGKLFIKYSCRVMKN
jgi:hypothetical protein